MILTKKDLRRYLECDRIAIGKKYKKPKMFVDRLWKFQIQYRKLEYYYNNRKKLLYSILWVFNKLSFVNKCRKMNSEFPINVIEEGLVIWHGQGIIINGHSKIGKNFSISRGCVIGQAHDEFPVIGDNVEMCIDSKILGGIKIANNTTIGANCLVIKDVTKQGTTLGGVPAKEISTKPNIKMLEKREKMEELL